MKCFAKCLGLLGAIMFIGCTDKNTASNSKRNGTFDDSSEVRYQINMEVKRVIADTNLFKDGLAWINVKGKLGVIDKNGNQLTPLKYDKSDHFHNGFAKVAISLNKPNAFPGPSDPTGIKYSWGVINKLGKEITSIKYDGVSDFENGIARVEANGKIGFIDEMGKEIIPPKYDEVTDLHHGIAVFKMNGMFGIINKNGKEIIPLKYAGINDFSEGLALVKEDIDAQSYRYGFIDTFGREVTPIKYHNAEDFSKGFAKIMWVGKYGYINRAGKEVVAPQYDQLEYFSEGLAAARRDGKFGFIDTTGREIIPFTYDYADAFNNGMARVNYVNKSNGEIRDVYIDRQGRICKIVPPSSNTNSNTSSVSNTSMSSESYDLSNTTKTCMWCGKTFTGKAWTTSMGEAVQWKGLGDCSRKCAMESYNAQRH